MSDDSRLIFNPDSPTIAYWYTPGGSYSDSVYIFDENRSGHFLLVSGGDTPGRSAVIQFANTTVDPYGYHYEGQAFSAVYPWRHSSWKENGKTYHEYPQTSTYTIVVGWGSEAYEYQFMNDGNVKPKVPMVAFAEPNATSVMFRHISGAVALYVKNCTGSQTTVLGFDVDANRRSDSTPAYLWPNLPDNGFVCNKRNGRVNISYLHTHETSNASNHAEYCMSKTVENADSILCVLPLPITNEATDFTFVAMTFTGYSPNMYCRTIRGLKIKRNHMYFLSTFKLESNTKKK